MLFRKEEKRELPDEIAMQDVMALLDEWHAPEPTAWFDARMMARFREEQARPAAGWMAQWRDRLLFGSATSLKPAMITALAVAMVAGGGGFWQVLHSRAATQSNISATVHDLQVLDTNDQTIQQMGQLLDDNDDNTPQS